LLLLAVNNGRFAGQRLIAAGFDAGMFPVQAATYAAERHLQGRIFSNFGWGGYLLLALPSDSVFMDGGTDFYGSALFRDHDAILSLSPGWRGILDKWKISAVLARSHSSLASEIVRSPGWSLWYCDSVAAIVKRDSTVLVKSPEDAEEQLKACAGPEKDAQPGR
jgi:hypothetical protein